MRLNWLLIKIALEGGKQLSGFGPEKKEFCMKSFSKLFGIIAMATVIGFSMVSCAQSNSPKAAAKTWVKALTEGDAAALRKIATPEAVDRASSPIVKSIYTSIPVKSYSEVFYDNGNTAIVTLTFKNKTTQTIKVIKLDDIWLVD